MGGEGGNILIYPARSNLGSTGEYDHAYQVENRSFDCTRPRYRLGCDGCCQAPGRQHSATVHSAMVRQLPASSYLSFGSAGGAGRVIEPTYMRIQTIGIKVYDQGD